MVLCKYFQQGTCRFGQYCKFEHAYGNRSKTFGDEKNIALLVAEDVLQAERGGQWLLSCYGPFKERKCIPGMDDLSPEEVRWEMYQAQKTGAVDQIKAQFQQMCEAMKVKRDALKNPTPAIVQLLEEVQSSGSENSAFGDKQKQGNYAFGQPQMEASNQPNQSSNVFGQKPAFGAAPSNPFGGGTNNTFGSNQQSSSIFGRPAAATTTNSVFGGKASFGTPSVFSGGTATAAPTAGGSIFGGGSKPAATPFGTVQNAPTFGGLATQGTNIFGGAATGTQSGFGQPPAFGAAQAQTAAGNAFLKPSTAQGSVFGGAATGGSVFGGNAAATAAAPAFGATPAAVSSAPSGTGIFGQPTQANAAFGGAPVFGGTAGFGAAQPTAGGSVFGGQSAFGAAPAAAASTNVFGGNTAAAATTGFGALAQQGATANAFGAASATPAVATNTFGAASATPAATNVFGAPAATPAAATNAFGVASATPAAATNAFGAAPISTTTGPFGGTANQADIEDKSMILNHRIAANTVFATSASAAPGPFGGNAAFSKPASFGFATPATNTTSVFGTSTATSTTQSPFGTNTFGNVQPQQQQQQQQSVFASSKQTTAAAANPFMQAKTQQQSSPFGVAPSTQSSPFGNFAKPTGNAFGSVSVTVMIDETAYSTDDCLTDDEKAAYRASAFTEGHIPLRPPTKELR
ncbi:hypothetical protein TSAR_008597 [Trichomalopsis sarcophagae]|uniref:Nucleoporin NUP42 n=1 Tax=Trichomalopsis sarcophagae TaxID=543379 RepID=A0A232F883_9HYME|nr:hypothetical protein TSAR_008597 [Trichomalopsis sarcophagae]